MQTATATKVKTKIIVGLGTVSVLGIAAAAALMNTASISARTITVVSPKGGEVLAVTKSSNILWTNTNNTAVNIYLLASDRKTVAWKIAERVTGGKFEWHIPNHLADKPAKFAVKIVEARNANNSAISPANFTIKKQNIAEGGWENLGEPLVLPSAYEMRSADFAFHPNRFAGYLSYPYPDSQGKLTFARFAGSWVKKEANPAIKAGAEDSFAIDPASGNLYYSACSIFDGNASNGYVGVWKFDGTAWAEVGNRIPTNGDCYYQSLALDPAGVPYIAYVDFDLGVKVVKFVDGSWRKVTGPVFGIADHDIEQPSIVFNKLGTLFLAFQQNGRLNIKIFSGGRWANAGTWNPRNADLIGLVSGPSGGKIYVGLDSRKDGEEDRLIDIFGFDGTDWTRVGDRITPGRLTGGRVLAYDPVSKAPLLAYLADYENPSDINYAAAGALRLSPTSNKWEYAGDFIKGNFDSILAVGADIKTSGFGMVLGYHDSFFFKRFVPR